MTVNKKRIIQVNVLNNNFKQNTTSLSLLAGRMVLVLNQTAPWRHVSFKVYYIAY